VPSVGESLGGDELAMFKRLRFHLDRKRARHAELDRTYRGVQLVRMLGLAIPQELRGFEFPLNWNRVTVDSIENRQDVKAFMRPGTEKADAAMWEGWQANNMDAGASLVHRETLVQGHTFVTVSTNAGDREHPLIVPESSRNMIAKINPSNRRIEAALRLYSDPWRSWAPDYATLYLPDSTTWLERDAGQWKIKDRDDHGLGRPPVVQFINRPRPDDFLGESEMADVMPLVEMATRVTANLQLAQEIVATPKVILRGAKKSDFLGIDGQPKGEWDAYMDAIWALASKEAAVDQVDPADLNNFIVVITMLAQQASAVTGLPMRYFGQNPANPAAEGAIRADESRLVKNVERKNRDAGNSWGDVMSLYERFRTGTWLPGARVTTEWYDAGTPTFAQKADAIQKMAGGTPVLSREGAWDELGWGTERKDRERGYFKQEALDIFGSEKDPAAPPVPTGG